MPIGSSPQFIVSLSGGKDSTALLFLMLERGMPVHSAAFFDTGWEFPAMHDHLAEITRRAGVPVVILRPAQPFVESMIHQQVRSRKPENKGEVTRIGWGWPSPFRRRCTRTKTDALDRYARGVPNAVTCIGYAADEAHRTKRKKMRRFVAKGLVRFPLIEWGVTEAQALAYCRRLGFTWWGLYDLFPRVSCFCCPLQRVGELRTLRRHFPDLWAKMLAWDAAIKDNVGFKESATVRDLDARFAEEDRFLPLPMASSCGGWR